MAELHIKKLPDDLKNKLKKISYEKNMTYAEILSLAVKEAEEFDTGDIEDPKLEMEIKEFQELLIRGISIKAIPHRINLLRKYLYDSKIPGFQKTNLKEWLNKILTIVKVKSAEVRMTPSSWQRGIWVLIIKDVESSFRDTNEAELFWVSNETRARQNSTWLLGEDW